MTSNKDSEQKWKKTPHGQQRKNKWETRQQNTRLDKKKKDENTRSENPKDQTTKQKSKSTQH